MALRHLIIVLPLLFASCSGGADARKGCLCPGGGNGGKGYPCPGGCPCPGAADGGKGCPCQGGDDGGKGCPCPGGAEGGKRCHCPAAADGGKECHCSGGGDGGKGCHCLNGCPCPGAADGEKGCPCSGGADGGKGCHCLDGCRCPAAADGGKECPCPGGGDGGKGCHCPDGCSCPAATDGGKECICPGGGDGGKGCHCPDGCPCPAATDGGKECPCPGGGDAGKGCHCPDGCPCPAAVDGGKECPCPGGGNGGKGCHCPDGCPCPTANDSGKGCPCLGDATGGKGCPCLGGAEGGKGCPCPGGADGGKGCPCADDADGEKGCPCAGGADGGKGCPCAGGADGGKGCPYAVGADGGKGCPCAGGANGGKGCPCAGGADGGKGCPCAGGADGGKGCPCACSADAKGCPCAGGPDGAKGCPCAGGADGGKGCPCAGGADGGKGGPCAGGTDGGKGCPCAGGGCAPKGADGGKDRPAPKGGGNSPKDAGGGKDTPKKKGGDDKKKAGAKPFYKQPILDSDYKGDWIIHNPNCGVNAMQHQLMPNNKAVWFDTTNLGPSARELGPKGNCPPNPDNNNEPDCFAHAVQYDIESGIVKSIYVQTDPWCSSGHLLPSGDLLSTGGNKMGGASVRLLKVDDPAPKFIDKKDALGSPHWYATNCILEDGSAAIIGGRDTYTYDIVGSTVDFKPNNKQLPFLQKTTAPAAGPGLHVENNLYPFCYLLPDGNIFIFANDRAISFNPQTGKTMKEYPVLKGGSRNYPPSGQSAILPLRLTADNQPVTVEVVVCGGNKADAFQNVDPRYTQNRVFTSALSDCNRIIATADNPTWQKEQDMPTPRVMGDLLQLPNGQFLLINGAKKGTSGWDDGEDPNLTPTVYMPENPKGKRFRELKPTNIPRMYHSSSSVLPDGKILVAGSQSHQFYTYDGNFPTELRVEKFSPHYLDPKLEKERPVITADATDKQLKYGKDFKVTFTIKSNPKLADGDVIVTLLHPPFTTHGYSQNQRMLICAITEVDSTVVNAVAPPSGRIAPPGYYMLFISHRNIPSKGVWVQVGA
ncbi:hypothetical protein Lser_V15G25700 [Lactuca serriola]